MAEQAYIQEESVGELVRRQEDTYIRGSTNISKYVVFSMHDTLEKIDAYLNSKHTSGETDSQGRDKPFFNIVTAAVNIWYRATDIDRKDIKIKPTKLADTLAAFLATVHLQAWMRRENFGSFLNDWGRSLARYGSTPLKFVEKGGRLIPVVVPWSTLIVDTVDFNNNVKIEVLEYTEGQLRGKTEYDQTQVEALCSARSARQTLDRQNKDSKNDYIKLYEVHGLLPKSLLTGQGSDQDIYTQQMHVISFVQAKNNGEYQDFSLFSGREAKDPYMITHLIREDNRTLSIGAVEHLFEAQWMMNHTVKSIKDQLDLASKLIFQTSDGNFVGQNALSAIENGDILIHKDGKPLTQVANTSHDISALESHGQMWKSLSNEIVGISESMMGQSAPSGTAWRQVNALLEENHSLFEMMTENKGIHIEEMMRNFVIPFLKKGLKNSKEIAAELEAHDIQKIDATYIKNASTKSVNDAVKKAILNNQKVTPQMQAQMTQDTQKATQESVSSMGAARFFAPSDIKSKTWADLFSTLEWDVDVDVTGEESPDKEDMATLSTVLQTIASNPRVLSDPNAKLIFNKILTMTGAVSSLELVEAQPYLPLPSKRFTETMDYTDVPDDIKRQMEEQAGFQPSQMGNNQPPAPPEPVPPTSPKPATPIGG